MPHAFLLQQCWLLVQSLEYPTRTLQARRTAIGRHCNSIKTAQPGDRTIDPDIVMPEHYKSSQRIDSLARVVIIPVHHTHTRLYNLDFIIRR